MLALTRKTDYALIALTYLTQRRQDGDGPISARQIAEQYDLPLPLLMNILKELNQAKIVRSTRGATGGYELIHDPETLTLLELINVVEGPVKFAPCCDELPIMGQGCTIKKECPIQGVVQRLHRRIIGMLNDITLTQIVEGEACCGCQQDSDGNPMDVGVSALKLASNTPRKK